MFETNEKCIDDYRLAYTVYVTLHSEKYSPCGICQSLAVSICHLTFLFNVNFHRRRIFHNRNFWYDADVRERVLNNLSQRLVDCYVRLEKKNSLKVPIICKISLPPPPEIKIAQHSVC